MKCPFCSSEYTEKMFEAYNGTYGCDTGCEYVTVVVFCENCKKKVYVKGDFGYFEDDDEKREYITNVSVAELKEALSKAEKF